MRNCELVRHRFLEKDVPQFHLGKDALGRLEKSQQASFVMASYTLFGV